MGDNPPDKFAFGSIEPCFHNKPNTALYSGFGNFCLNSAFEEKLGKLFLIVLLINLKNFSPAEEHISFLVGLMEFFIAICRGHRFLDLRDGLACEDGFVDHAAASEKEDIA